MRDRDSNSDRASRREAQSRCRNRVRSYKLSLSRFYRFWFHWAFTFRGYIRIVIELILAVFVDTSPPPALFLAMFWYAIVVDRSGNLVSFAVSRLLFILTCTRWVVVLLKFVKFVKTKFVYFVKFIAQLMVLLRLRTETEWMKRKYDWLINIQKDL